MDFIRISSRQTASRGFKRILFLGPLWGLIFIILGCAQVADYQDPETVNLQVHGDISDEAVIEEVVQILEKNLNAVSNSDMDAYLSTIVPAARLETRKELEESFSTLDVQVTILDVEVLDQQSDRILLRADQQTIVQNYPNEEGGYRDHLAEANHTFVKIDGNWYLQETVMTNTQFIYDAPSHK